MLPMPEVEGLREAAWDPCRSGAQSVSQGPHSPGISALLSDGHRAAIPAL